VRDLPGVTIEICRWSEDDYIDHDVVCRSNFGFETDYRHDIGNAYVFEHKFHWARAAAHVSE
jgi:hypothetical protein